MFGYYTYRGGVCTAVTYHVLDMVVSPVNVYLFFIFSGTVVNIYCTCNLWYKERHYRPFKEKSFNYHDFTPPSHTPPPKKVTIEGNNSCSRTDNEKYTRSQSIFLRCLRLMNRFTFSKRQMSLLCFERRRGSNSSDSCESS